ncbi:hypothetical protein [Kitasatospora sp. NPDC090091]|uniref:hypothetical protein n=1 Tax=Kitasatospora sp. NPDC090091 TaxID=3364081 RepID=UPI00381A5CF4
MYAPPEHRPAPVLLQPLTPPALPPGNPAGMRWLAELHADPQSCLDAWTAGRLAGIPLGRFEVLRVSASIGYAILQNGPRTAPVLHTVALGTTDFFLIPGSMPAHNSVGMLQQTGVLPCPAPGRALPRRRTLPLPGEHVSPEDLAPTWLVKPDGSGDLWHGEQVLAATHSAYAYFDSLSHHESTPAPAQPGAPRPEAAAQFIAASRRAS